MKKVISAILAMLLILSVASFSYASYFDLSQLSLEDLKHLQEDLNLALWNCGGWQEVTVPVGIYEVGKDIPEGKWEVSAANEYAYIRLCGKYENGDVHDFFVSESLKDGNTVNLNCFKENYIEVSSGSVIFRTATNLGFSFN